MQISFDDIKKSLEPHGLVVVSKRALENLKKDVYLFEYKNYEHYREVQILNNKRKIGFVWADEYVLDAVANEIQFQFPGKKLKGLCHGTRNGFEQNYLAEKFGMDVLGTDISDTAKFYPRSLQWDFHDEHPDWLNCHDFVYTNSFDQSWQPKAAIATWMNQLKVGGFND